MTPVDKANRVKKKKKKIKILTRKKKFSKLGKQSIDYYLFIPAENKFNSI